MPTKKLEDNEAMKKRLKEDGRWEEFTALRKKNLDSRNLLPAKKKREIWKQMGYDCFGNKIGEAPKGLKDELEQTDRNGVYQAISPGATESTLQEIYSTDIDDVQWIYLNLSSKENFTQPPPNGGAKALLRLIQANGSLMTEFSRQLFKKMETERQAKKGFSDDGREILEKIEYLLTQFKERDVL